MEWAPVWVLVILVAGNTTVVGHYGTREACEKAGAEWRAPQEKKPSELGTSTGRNFRCLPAEVGRFQ